ncbi:MAG: 50S ribosomal protein L11 methyltransferase [bacterium]|nr:50S ribosomal protein L11 methyltransferase [bacterium]
MPHRDKVVTYREISIVIDREIQDVVCDYIIEHVSSGLLLEDEDGRSQLTVKFYLPDSDERDFDEALKCFIEELAEDHGLPAPTLYECKVENVSWEEEYRKSVKPVTVGEDIIIRPTWDASVSEHPYQLLIEPKMAFGTGTHETTRSCLQAIRDHLEPGLSFLDIGCGSGILSILADKMEASFIKAVDYDEIAVENSRENFHLNSVTTEHEILCGTIDICADDEPYNFVCANIIRQTIIEILPQLDRLTSEHGKLVLSGLLEMDLPEVQHALRDQGLTDLQIYPDNEWRTVIIFKG